ncbi:hypothetical protein MRB53_000741 [Persea americana]|uniref:Uncharacterized protein n=1 Tax=Persea americana TaxID=3435 RepID=A0ACC2MQE4_PERAE|nr:hypothetical protein MRB53_000741 [Persea americana]
MGHLQECLGSTWLPSRAFALRQIMPKGVCGGGSISKIRCGEGWPSCRKVIAVVSHRVNLLGTDLEWVEARWIKGAVGAGQVSAETNFRNSGASLSHLEQHEKDGISAIFVHVSSLLEGRWGSHLLHGSAQTRPKSSNCWILQFGQSICYFVTCPPAELNFSPRNSTKR